MKYVDDISRIIDAVKIISPNSFSFAGKTFTANAGIPYQSNGSKAINPLVQLLTDVLYQHCYCKKFDGTYYESPVMKDNKENFQAALSRANSTIERWDKDWIIEQILPTGQYVALKNGKYRLLYPGEFITTEYQSALPHQGTHITIQCLKESFTLQPAFYFAFSNEIGEQQNLNTVIRFYWNITSAGACRLIELLTNYLNKYTIPFSFKCLNNSALFTRSDAAVLYVSKPYYNITAQILTFVYPQIKSELKSEVPGFTKELNAGLGLAEDPGTGESFGMSRCEMIAQGIYNGHHLGTISNEKMIDQVKEVFNARGIQINKPYLNEGSQDIYEVID